MSRRRFGDNVRLTRILATAAVALALVATTGCEDDRTPAEKAADQAREQQEETNKQKERVLGRLLDPTGWNESEKKFTEGSGDSAVHYAVVTTGQVKCSPVFRLGSGGEHYFLVAVVPHLDAHADSRVELSELPSEFKDNERDLSKGKFERLARKHRDSSAELRAICADR